MSQINIISQDKIEEQLALCSELIPLIRARSETDAPLAFVDTYGCQQNESDSEQIRGFLSLMGCGFTTDEFLADIIVINTCAVREHAEMRILGNVGALNHTKKAKKGQIIAVCGCMVRQEHMEEKLKKSYPIVDIVFGPDEVWRFPELIMMLVKGRKRVFEVTRLDGSLFENLPRRRDSKLKAWLSIMYGCNNFCTYCIVPYTRGRERSRKPEDILREAKELIASGACDITLLGQNVNSYGKDLGIDYDFADLIKDINALEGDFIIRFMTSHPKDAGEKLFKTMAECSKAAHHIHLPVQAGNNRVLKAMNRHYTREEYLEKVRLAREYMPDLVITTDIIVGFPGETPEEFEDTLSLVNEVRYDSMFTFIYSPRVGTKAAAMPDPLSRAEKQILFDKLTDAANTISKEKHAEYVGRTVRVLVDGVNEGEEYNLSSRTKEGRLVHLKGCPEMVGSFAEVKITSSTTWALFGEISGQ